MQILLISNMGPKASAPVQGQFIEQQRQALSEPTAYHWMRWHSDSALNRLLKYPVWLLDFLLRFVCSRKRYDILHVHFYYPTIWLAILYKWLRNRSARIIVTCHGSDIYQYQPAGFWYRWCAGWADQWIFTSPALQQSFFIRPAQSRVLSAGIAAHFADCEPLPLAQKDIDLLFVGTLNDNKGLDRLQLLLPKLQDKNICIIGQGPAAPQVRQWLTHYANLSWFPSQTPEQLKVWYQRSKLLLSLSRQESFGLVMTEALACYTPVLATDTDGARAQLQPDFGWIVDQRQSEDELMKQLLAQLQLCWQLPEQDYQRMQQAGRNYAVSQLLPVIATELMALYQSLCNQQGQL
ncbi:glycosyltransferase family 4 protein [Alkalimonas sp. NCh-2]|uniref:glycosyltransferase family 4 protein n=1 Tax=Alkalimonas sp. NCh-2 TaxID=3144846 RepID=UPI0031F5F44A